VPPVIEVHGLRKSYGDVERIHGIDFEVAGEEILGLLGTNGAGQTTTIEILEGYRPRNGGDVSVLGVDPAHPNRAWRNRIGLVLQECELSPHYTVRETLSMFSRYFESLTDVEAVVDLVGLVDKADDRVAQLSGGQKRRLDVGLGLVGDPELLFLDEPTTGLDPAARREMWEMIEGLRDAGKTVLLTTHYMDEADHLADRIIILRHGEIVAQGTSDELRDSLGDVTHIAFRVPADARLDLLGMEAEVSTHLDGALVRIPSKSVQADLGRVLHWADRQALELADLEVVRPTLDDVFVELAEAPPQDAREQ
jgi:ABC-2 type transport system ATP-binding protein